MTFVLLHFQFSYSRWFLYVSERLSDVNVPTSIYRIEETIGLYMNYCLKLVFCLSIQTIPYFEAVFDRQKNERIIPSRSFVTDSLHRTTFRFQFIEMCKLDFIIPKYIFGILSSAIQYHKLLMVSSNVRNVKETWLLLHELYFVMLDIF